MFFCAHGDVLTRVINEQGWEDEQGEPQSENDEKQNRREPEPSLRPHGPFPFQQESPPGAGLNKPIPVIGEESYGSAEEVLQ